MTAAIPLSQLVTYFDSYLRVREIPDEPHALNGLQVESRGVIRSVVAAVDASQQAIEGAARGSLLLVHHGLFWEGNQPVTGRRYRRIQALLERDIALYSAHIPLDVHPEVGNNTLLAARLGLSACCGFGTYRGILLGVAGEVVGLSRDQLRSRVEHAVGIEPGAARLISGGPETPHRVGIITGSGGSMISQALEAGCDTLVSGEGAAHTYLDAMELGLNLIYAGHYATETLGVKALAAHVAGHFQLPWEFHDYPTGM